jgi:class 3 adenylate cyclase
MATKSTTVRRNAAALPWLRAVAFAGVTFLAVSLLGFYPGVAPYIAALVVGVLGLFAPGAAVLVFVVVAGLPLLAGDIIVGAVFLVLGFSAITYLAEDDAKAFLVIALAFAASLVHAEWAVAALAGYFLGASEGAIAAFVACLVIEGAGIAFGVPAIGVLATGGAPARALVDLTALRSMTNGLGLAWLAPALARIDAPKSIRALASVGDVALVVLQPIVWAIAAAVAGLVRRPVGDARRRPLGFASVGLGIAAAAVLTIVGQSVLHGPGEPATLGLAAAICIVVAALGVAVSEFVFTPSVAPRATAAATTSPQPEAGRAARDEADVDELLRTIASAEEELAAKHTVSATVLITDMKSFSRLTQELGSTETAKLVQRHRDLLLPVVEKHGGKGRSSGGDGLIAAFDTPMNALEAVVEMQRVLAEYNSHRTADEPVEIRAGVAIGEIVIDKGGKPFLGDALNVAARIMSLADGGQVFTSRTVIARAGEPPYGSVSHGPFTLKNIAKPVEIMEVLWGEGQEARPPHPGTAE